MKRVFATGLVWALAAFAFGLDETGARAQVAPFDGLRPPVREAFVPRTRWTISRITCCGTARLYPR